MHVNNYSIYRFSVVLQAKEEALNQEIEKLRTELLLQQQKQQHIIDQKVKEIATNDGPGSDSAVCSIM